MSNRARRLQHRARDQWRWKKASDEQVRLWVLGESHHLGDKAAPHSQCCPDFSCCSAQRTPREERERFAARYAEDGHAPMDMLMAFLGRGLAQHAPEKDVYIAGREEATRG